MDDSTTVLDTAAAAQRLGCSPYALRRLRSAGRGPRGFRASAAGRWRYRIADLEALDQREHGRRLRR